MPLEVIGGVLGGLGLFLVGMSLLSDSMKALANRRIRTVAVRWTPNRLAAFGWGTLAGAIMQVMHAMTFIVVSMRQTGLITTQRSFAIILGGNLGTVLLIMVVVLDIKLLTFYVLGIAGIAVVSSRAGRYRRLAGTLFGAAMVFVGLILIREHAALIAEQAWFSDVFNWTQRSLWFAFLGAILLTFIAQSSIVVMVLAISLVTVGVISVDEVIMVMNGACVGSSLILLALSTNVAGTARQIAMFQVAYNFILAAVFVPLLYVELAFEIPLFKAAVSAVTGNVGHQMGILLIIYCGAIALGLLALLGPLTRLYERLWPPTRLEELSKTQYIHDRASADMDSALMLADLEQRRAFSMFSEYFEVIRAGGRVGRSREVIRAVLTRIDEFLEESRLRHDSGWTEELNSALTRQRMLTWLEEQLAEFCDALSSLPERSRLESLKLSLLDGVETVLLVCYLELDDHETGSWATTTDLTSNQSATMRKIRASYLSGDTGQDESDRARLLDFTNRAEQIFFLLSKLTDPGHATAGSQAPGPEAHHLG